jgi:RNA polymerase sigma-70 factor (ECF subfamily)
MRLADVDDPRGRGGGQERLQFTGCDAAIGRVRLRVVHGRIILPFVNPEDPDLSKSAPEGVKDLREADEATLVAAARRDRQAFGLLYDRHFDAVYNYIVRRVGDDAVAEDIAAEVWERAMVAIERFEQRGVPFAAWLYRIAGNLVINHHRKAGLWRLVPFADRIAAARPFRQTEVRTAVESALASLSPADQEVIALYYYGGQNPEEMAVILGCSVVAVHKRLHRARERLKGHLGGDPRAGSESA